MVKCALRTKTLALKQIQAINSALDTNSALNRVAIVSSETLKAIIIDRLKSEADNIKQQWSTAEGSSTHYFYIDNLLPDDIANDIYQAFPKNAEGFYQRKSFREKKSTLTNLVDVSTVLSDISNAFHFPELIEVIGNSIDMGALEADRSLYASGLSMMFKGDFLNPHLDNSHDGKRNRYRRLNLLYYVSPRWSLDNGGNIELWDDKVKNQTTLISKFNRLVVMETNRESWHSVSPVSTMNPRCCVSNYYFSEISPDGSEYFHVTSFTGRPGQTARRAWGVVDNFLRNCISRTLKTGRGTQLINKRLRD